MNSQNYQPSLNNLAEYLELSCEHTLVEQIITNVRNIANSRKIDIEVLAEEILSAVKNNSSTAPIYSWVGYINKIANTVAPKCVGKKKEFYTPTLILLHLDLKANNFKGELWEMLYIDEIVKHCLKEFPITIDEMKKLLHSITDWCIEKDFKTFSKYADCLLHSKLVKLNCNVPTQVLIIKAKEVAQDWEKMMNELFDPYDIYEEKEK